MKSKVCPACNGTGIAIDQEKLGRSLRKRREDLGITGREMAHRIRLSHSYVSELERGRKIWDSDLIARYEKALEPVA